VATVLSQRRRLGELLLEVGAVDSSKVSAAMEEQVQTKERFGQVLIRLGLASQKDIGRALARQLGFPYVDLDVVVPQETALLAVPEHLARQFQIVPLELTGRSLKLGMVDPLDVRAVDDVCRYTGCDVETTVVTHDHFLRVLSAYSGPDESAGLLTGELATRADRDLDVHLRSMIDEAPVVRLVDLLLLRAIRQRASDIHIEPQKQHVRVRYRTDGVLYNGMTLPRRLHEVAISRLKIMAQIDIAQRRLPQDGRIQLKIDGREIDIRVSTIPTVYGEKIVLRILDKSTGPLALDRIGLLPDDRRRLESLVRKPHGIVLLTGPTGSGKTTTLYGILSKINSTGSNIVSIEDPVEYQIAGVNQVQVNFKAGLTFAGGLRSVLRQDPDIIMVGEIRDEETARIAIHAALTGHLVFSTLHTNDAAGALTRLVDMGIEPFLVASSVVGVITQRLARRLCDRCKRPYPSQPELLQIPGALPAAGDLPVTFYRSHGCDLCNDIGYRGRTGVFEIMVVDEAIKALVARGAPASMIKAEARRAGMRTLVQDGLQKAMMGITSPEEALDVLGFEE
jgi:type IV pilus assembly protein PilB